MASPDPKPPRYCFDDVVVDREKFCLSKHGKTKTVAPRAFDLLVYLIEHGDRVIEKQELFERVWKESFVTDNALTQAMKEVRRAIGDDADSPHYIMTLPKRGYRFIANVSLLPDEPPDLIVEKHSRLHVAVEEGEVSWGERQRITEQGLPAGALLKGVRPRLRLRVIAACVAATALAALAGLLLLSSRPKRAQGAAVQSIAVLPFNPISAEGHDGYLELGMADALITRLSNIKAIVVRPTSAVRQYSNPDRDPIAAGRDLKVQSVLEGSVQKIGDKVRVTVRLIDVQDGRPLWAYECNDRCSDIFELQDSISEKIARALALTLTGDEKKLLAKRYTDNTEAYQLYLKGRYFWNKRTEDGLRKAIEYFQQAIDLDARYALAYAGLADSYNVLGSLGWITPQEQYAKVEAAATRALEIDDALAEAHNSLAWVRFARWDWPGAEIEFKRALELNPNYAAAHQWYAEYLTGMARFDEAIAEIRRAQQIEPASLIINTIVAQTYLNARQYDQAIEQCHKTLELDPNFELAYTYLGNAYTQKGMYEEAIAAFRKAKQWDGTPRTLGRIGVTYAISGNREQATRALQKLVAAPKQTYVPAYAIAAINASLGNRDEAFGCLEKEFNEHSPTLVFLKVDPYLDNLRQDPRFQDLLRRMGLI